MKQTLELVTALSHIAARTTRARADGHFTTMEKLAFAAELGGIYAAAQGIEQVPAEFLHITDETKTELVAGIVAALAENGGTEDIQDKAHSILEWAYGTIRMIAFLRFGPSKAIAA